MAMKTRSLRERSLEDKLVAAKCEDPETGELKTLYFFTVNSQADQPVDTLSNGVEPGPNASVGHSIESRIHSDDNGNVLIGDSVSAFEFSDSPELLERKIVEVDCSSSDSSSVGIGEVEASSVLEEESDNSEIMRHSADQSNVRAGLVSYELDTSSEDSDNADNDDHSGGSDRKTPVGTNDKGVVINPPSRKIIVIISSSDSSSDMSS